MSLWTSLRGTRSFKSLERPGGEYLSDAGKRHNPKRRYLLIGGPYDGDTVPLTDGTTAPIRVGDWFGRYLCAVVAPRGPWGAPCAQTGEAKWQHL